MLRFEVGEIRSFMKRIELDHPTVELHYTCPLTPPEGCKPLTQEVLDMVKTGSPGRTRTCDMAVTRAPPFPEGLDYLITPTDNSGEGVGRSWGLLAEVLIP